MALALAVLVMAVMGTAIWQKDRENTELKKRLDSLEPRTPILVEKMPCDIWRDSAEKVIAEGEDLTCRTLEINSTWRRPDYLPVYHSTAWRSRRFSYVPRLLAMRGHRVFLFDGGGSDWFTLLPMMGFDDTTCPVGIASKTRIETVIIALEAQIQSVKAMNGQAVVVMKPKTAGYHLIAVPTAALRKLTLRAATPDGSCFEIPAAI